VAVDGVDGSGKSVFADQMAALLSGSGRHVIRASADDFHRSQAERYRRGRASPLGFWLDSYDYDRLRSDLLDPLRSTGPARYRLAVHDVATDEPVNAPWHARPPRAVLVLDGLFLHRQELRHYWDLSVYLDVPFEVTAARMALRDGTQPDPDHSTMARYVEGQRLYLAECSPRALADVVIDNADWEQPRLLHVP
jgi:uridine kinase